ncbi:MAG: aminotransferase class V-fold PLP-dependent enzyme [Candidatus Krumholzibacteriia bacterium]
MESLPPLPGQRRVRAEFPALAADLVFMENAGGSQVPACVADAVHRYLRETYVQVGAGYPLSDICTTTVADAHAFARAFLNARRGEAILGPSTTALLGMLADCYARVLPAGAEIILAENGHEANLGCWDRLQDRGVVVRWWRVDPETATCTMDGLADLLSERTALVALPHVSNLVGEVADLGAVVRAAHAVGARVVADGVAYAPHHAPDVDAWDVDWYAYSAYKVYGPHLAVLYGRDDALAELPGPNHFFVTRDEGAYYFEPGGPSHEACAGLLALGDYLALVAGVEAARGRERETVVAAFDRFPGWERPLLERLLDRLAHEPAVRVIGSPSAGADRVGTVSFVHERLASRAIAASLQQSGIAVRNGNMYAWRLCRALGLDPADGVVRVSFVHYNTVEDMERVVNALDHVL